jgi:NADH-quinone oxidoreductase subunit H
MTTTNIVMTLIPVLLMIILSLGLIPLFIWMERRISALIQHRKGPNRCNIKGIRLGGIIQSVADVIKLVFKEEFYPGHIKSKFLYLLAPGIVFFAAFLTFAVIPFADDVLLGDKSYAMQALPVDLGILWFVALSGIAIYGIIIAGWSSHNKFGILGSLRASAQMISYEIALGLAIISMILTYNSVDFNDMIHYQSQTLFGFLPAWGILIQPLAAVIFIVTLFAETNRAPFDVAEGESEIVAGFHTEYSAMKFALFFMAEYIAMNSAAAIIITVFFGGYNLPWIDTQMMLENPQTLLISTMIVLALIFFVLMRWIYKNNCRKGVACVQRTTEVKILLTLFSLLLILSEALLIWLYVQEASGVAITSLVTVLQVTTFVVKLFIMNTFFVIVRWTFPRFRYDQIQHLGWYILLPFALINIFITAFVVVL